jgi:predicted RNase H-like HicB family nuclease
MSETGPFASGRPAELPIQLARETDGRWIAEIPAIPGAMAYAASPIEAVAAVRDLAEEVIGDRRAHGESVPKPSPDDRPLTMGVCGFTAAVSADAEGGTLVGWVPGLTGAHTQGDSLEELYSNLVEVIELVAEDSAPGLLPEKEPSTREN